MATEKAPEPKITMEDCSAFTVWLFLGCTGKEPIPTASADPHRLGNRKTEYHAAKGPHPLSSLCSGSLCSGDQNTG